MRCNTARYCRATNGWRTTMRPRHKDTVQTTRASVVATAAAYNVSTTDIKRSEGQTGVACDGILFRNCCCDLKRDVLRSERARGRRWFVGLMMTMMTNDDCDDNMLSTLNVVVYIVYGRCLYYYTCVYGICFQTPTPVRLVRHDGVAFGRRPSNRSNPVPGAVCRPLVVVATERVNYDGNALCFPCPTAKRTRVHVFCSRIRQLIDRELVFVCVFVYMHSYLCIYMLFALSPPPATQSLPSVPKRRIYVYPTAACPEPWEPNQIPLYHWRCCCCCHRRHCCHHRSGWTVSVMMNIIHGFALGGALNARTAYISRTEKFMRRVQIPAKHAALLITVNGRVHIRL